MELDNEEQIDNALEQAQPETAHEGGEAPKGADDANKNISTREALKTAIKEAKEKDETPKPANAKQVKPVRAGEAKQDDKVPKTGSADNVQAAEVQPKQVEAPRSWTAANKAEFYKLPTSVQTQILDREKAQESLIGKHGQTAEYGNKIKETFSPYDAIITAEGGTHEKAIKELLNSAYILRRGTPIEKARMVADTMRRFGVDLRVLNGQPQQQQPQQNINQLVEQGVKTHLEKFQQQQQLDSATREWQAFQNDPAHPHCELVWQDMQALLNGGRAQGYQDAYDKAVWANPELRSTLVAETAEQRNAELKKANDARRRAGSSLSGAPGKTSPTIPVKQGKTTADDIRNAIAQVRGGE